MWADAEAIGVSSERPQIMSRAISWPFRIEFFEYQFFSRISYFLNDFMHEATEYFPCCHLPEIALVGSFQRHRKTYGFGDVLRFPYRKMLLKRRFHCLESILFCCFHLSLSFSFCKCSAFWNLFVSNNGVVHRRNKCRGLFTNPVPIAWRER